MKASEHLKEKKIRKTWKYRNQNLSKSDERISKKRVPQKNKKISRNQTRLYKSYQMNNHSASSPCKIFWTILKMDERRTQTNGPEDKETDDDTQCFIPER